MHFIFLVGFIAIVLGVVWIFLWDAATLTPNPLDYEDEA